MASGKFLEVFERFDFHPAVLVKPDMYGCTAPKFGRQDFFGPARWNQNCTFALSERMLPPIFCVAARGYCMSRLSAKEAPPYFCVGVRRRGRPARARRRGARQGGRPARSCRAWRKSDAREFTAPACASKATAGFWTADGSRQRTPRPSRCSQGGRRAGQWRTPRPARFGPFLAGTVSKTVDFADICRH